MRVINSSVSLLITTNVKLAFTEEKKQPSNISASVNIETIIHIKTAKLNALMYIIIETNKHCSLVVNYEHDS